MRASVQLAVCLVLTLSLLTVSCGQDEGKRRAVECQTDDDCDDSKLGVCGSVVCENNSCVVGTLPDGRRCNDEDPLTGADACLTGICKGVAKVCEDDLGPCLKAVHDPETDECVVEPVEDGAPCDDENACTRRDTCDAGECVGAQPKSCAAADACHVEGECDPESGECSEVPAEDGQPCDDGQACTSADACQGGACAGEAVVCDDGLGCSIDACDEESGACSSDTTQCTCVTDADCSDGNACNGAERCNPSRKLCERGEAVTCAANPDPCLTDVCVPETGACEPAPAPDGTACDDGSACTGRDTCRDGVCDGAEPVVCTALSQCHTPGACNPLTGACSNPEKPKNSACNDGNACTVTDTCQAGACVGSAPVSCAAIDQCHDGGVCNTRTGACTKPAKQNGVRCDDGSACTIGDACQDGTCTPASQVVCVAADSCHLPGTCDNSTGQCSSPSKPNGSSCNDGKTCTSSDVCTNGACGGTKLTCDDGIACTKQSCSEELGGCTTDASACSCQKHADCDDGNPCNGVEACDAGTLKCLPGTAVSCSALDSECSVGACDAGNGKCVAKPRADGTACNDGNSCTASSSCRAGACVGQNPTSCVASDQCHTAGTCNPATGVCSDPVKANGATCNDGNACTKTDSCQSGACVGAAPVTCAASDACHNAGACNPSTGACEASTKPNGTTCSDGDACTKTDTCQGGVCAGANPVTCVASDQCHNAGTCNSSTGACSNPAKANGTSCNDSNVCTRTDACQEGVCKGASPITCAAVDDCHGAGSCDPAKGCSKPVLADGTVCNDGNKCTLADTCAAGVCKGASPVVCRPSDQCHEAGTCDASTGLCSNPSKANDTPCNDGQVCTSSDKCLSGVCRGAAVTCDDKIACTVDSCVEPSGCTSDGTKCQCAKNADCDDKDACNGVEVCNLATFTCVAGTKLDCSKLDDVCNVGACDSKTGACSARPRADGTACDDSSACTQKDLCRAGTCVGTAKRNNADAKAGDWADDPGTIPVAGKPWVSVGPRSADTFGDAKGNVHLVGTYSGTIAFDDKDAGAESSTLLDLFKGQTLGIYWATYDEVGTLVSLANLGGVTEGGALAVTSAAGNEDGSFTLVGTFSGSGAFGRDDKTKNFPARPLEVFVAHFAASGEIQWVVEGVPSKGVTASANAVASFDDGKVIAIGLCDGGLSFVDSNDKPFGSVREPGVWAMEVDSRGGNLWARTVVQPDGGSLSARAVTTHEDGSASLTGGFTVSAKLGKISVAVVKGEDTRDIWFEHLDAAGEIEWGGRVGGDKADVPGDVARIKGGGLLLLANTLGATPNADDAKTTQQLHVAGPGLQTHVLGLDEAGVLLSAGLIANPARAGGATQGYQLKRDASGTYALAGTFASGTSFYGKAGFGAGAPAAADFSIKSALATPGPLSLFLARVDARAVFDWGVQAGGDRSGMTSNDWSISLSAHRSRSATVAGIFNATSSFGDVKTETLAAAPDKVGNAFVVHLNSQAEYDYCP